MELLPLAVPCPLSRVRTGMLNQLSSLLTMTDSHQSHCQSNYLLHPWRARRERPQPLPARAICRGPLSTEQRHRLVRLARCAANLAVVKVHHLRLVLDFQR